MPSFPRQVQIARKRCHTLVPVREPEEARNPKLVYHTMAQLKQKMRFRKPRWYQGRPSGGRPGTSP